MRSTLNLASIALFGLFLLFAFGTTGDSNRSGGLSTASKENACKGWDDASMDVRRYAVRLNIEKLDPTTVDTQCLLRRTDEIVRWTSRLCGGGHLPKDAYALAFVEKAREMCP